MSSFRDEARRFARRDAWRQGLAFFEEAVRAHPEASEARAYLGFFCVKDSRFDTPRAIVELVRATELDPGSGLPHAFLGLTLGSLRLLDEGLRRVGMAKELGVAASEALLAEAQVELDAGSVERAIEIFGRLVELEDDSTSRVLLSQAHSQAGDQEAALEWARRAWRADAGDFRAPAYMGVYLAYLRRFDEAREALQASLRLERAFAMTHHTLAFVAAEEGRTEEAEVRLRIALEHDPLYVTSRKRLADLCASGGRSGEARRHYELCLEHFSSYDAAREALGRLPRESP